MRLRAALALRASACLVLGTLQAALASCTAVPRDRVAAEPAPAKAEDAATLAREGEELFEREPRTRPAVERAYRALARAAGSLGDDYDLFWKTARALAWLADAGRGGPTQEELAKTGLRFATSALALRPSGAEALYYHAMNTGLLADANHNYGLDAMATMTRELQASAAADERFDRAGALRLLGILYTRAPGPPSGVGSLRKALRSLRRAVELFPEDAENLLYLGEAEVENGEAEAGRAHLEAALRAPLVAGRTAEQEGWRAEARKRLEASPQR